MATSTLMFNAVNHGRPDDVMRRIFPQMIAAAKVDPMPASAYQVFVGERRRAAADGARAAPRERGELPAGVDVALVHDLLVGPLVYRWMVSDGDVGGHRRRGDRRRPRRRRGDPQAPA